MHKKQAQPPHGHVRVSRLSDGGREDPMNRWPKTRGREGKANAKSKNYER